MDNRILLVSNGLVHPTWLARWWLKHNLQTMPGYVFRQVGSLEILPRLDTSAFRAMVLYFHHKTISASALARLDEFVHGGGGVLAIHSATASFKEASRYFEILGGRFKEHGAIETFEVSRAAGRNDVFGAVAPFRIKDELYLHELSTEITVHFQAMLNGEPAPVVWTRRYGAGRVCYAMPGHTAESIRHPAVNTILKQGLAWVCQS
jgi:type 1 glutamine amidotransferase